MSKSQELDATKLRDLIANTKLDLVTGNLEFDSERNPKKQVSFLTIKDGKVLLKEKY